MVRRGLNAIPVDLSFVSRTTSGFNTALSVGVGWASVERTIFRLPTCESPPI